MNNPLPPSDTECQPYAPTAASPVPNRDDEVLPLVTVLMPIRNECDFIENSLRAVMGQNYPAERMEVLVVDGMSTDGTRQIVAAWQTRYTNLFLLDNEQIFVSQAQNLGIRRARGSVIVLVGGHCEIGRNYIRNCVAHLKDDRVDAVGGPLETIGEKPVAGTISAAVSSRFGVGDCAFRTVTDRTMLVDTVAFAAYTREIIDRAGPFDEQLVRNQDDEFNYRIRALGAKILLSENVRSRYYSRASFRRLGSQYFQYGYWKVRVTQKHPRQMKARHFVPPAFVLSLLVSGILSPFSDLAYYTFLAILSLYASASAIASWRKRKGMTWSQVILLPFAFATLHLSYGLGFLTGLVRFVNQWPLRIFKQ